MIIFDKETRYSILIPNGCAESISVAAETLKDYFKRCLDLELSITNIATTPFISIGLTNELKKLSCTFDEKELNVDGFKILFKDKNVYLCGAKDRGTVYAVNDFAEKYMGVRFLSPDSTVYPKLELLEIEEKDITEIPSFQSRCLYFYNVKVNPSFASKMRLVSPYTNPEKANLYGGGHLRDWNSNIMHSMQYFMPIDKYYEQHPEWYSNTNIRGWLCLTDGLTDEDQDDGRSDSLLAIISENIIEEIKKCSTQKYFMLGHQDSNEYCQCERCKKSRERNVTASGYLMVWINAIAKRVEKWRKENCPDREIYIVSFSYHETIIPPVYIEENGINQTPFEYFEREFWAPLRLREGNIVPVNKNVIPEENVIIFCAPMATCYLHDMNDKNCDWNQYSGFTFKGWNALNAKFMLWYYGVNFYHYPWWLPNRRTMRKHLLFYKQYEPLFVLHQGAPNEGGLYQSILNTYILSKLMWNLDLDTNQLTKEFNDLYFGKDIAPYVDSFIEKIENHYAEIDVKYKWKYHSDLGDNFESSKYFKNFPYEFLTSCIDDLNLAITKTDDEEIKKKIKRVVIHPLYMLAYNFDKYENAEIKYLDMLEQYFNDLEIKNLNELAKSPSRFMQEIRSKL